MRLMIVQPPNENYRIYTNLVFTPKKLFSTNIIRDQVVAEESTYFWKIHGNSMK